MSAIDITPERAVMYLAGLQSYVDGGVRVTPVGGQLGGTALMGSDGTVAAEFPTLVKPRGFGFDGANTLITVPDSPLLSFGDGVGDVAFSIAVMFRQLTLGTVLLACKATTVTNGEYAFYVTNDRVGTLLIDTSEGAYIGRSSGAGVIQTGVDKVYIMTYDGSKTAAGVKLYVNNVRVDANDEILNVYQAMEPGANDVLIGAGLGAGIFDGDIMVPTMIFDFELDTDDVSLLTKIMRNQYETSPR